MLDVREVSNITDFYVIFTGTSSTHLNALVSRIDNDLALKGAKPSSVEGSKSASWLVLDYGSVICHAMVGETRKYYALERLWGDAPQVDWQTQ